jgi:hypothetical protein
MVHALEEAWRILVPYGMMIDVRPLCVDVPLEVVYEGGRESTGIVDLSPEIDRDIAADQAINSLVMNGKYKVANIEYFDYAYYWNSFNAMVTDFEERWKDEIIIPRDVIRKARTLYQQKRPKTQFRLGMRMKLGKYEKQE